MIALVAIDKAGGIGKDGKLPWKNKEDSAWFKEKTLGKNIVVGSKTFSELPNLKDRKVYVFSSSDADSVTNKNGLTGHYLDSDYIKWRLNNLHKRNFEKLKADLICCGGGQLYKYLIPQCSELYITHLDKTYECDTFFPFTMKKITNIFPKCEFIRGIEGGNIVKYYR